MARKKRRRENRHCARCGDRYWPDELRRGLCPLCAETLAKVRRRRTGERLLERATESTVERDGRTFTVKTLPPKRRRP